jgi:hypothetical protein
MKNLPKFNSNNELINAMELVCRLNAYVLTT